MDEIVVSNDQRRTQQTTFQQYQPPGSMPANDPPPPPPPPSMTMVGGKPQQKKFELIDGKWVQLTAAGVPRKKPGRKPGTIVKPRSDADQPKMRRPRKSRDADAPAGVQRKRKAALTDTEQEDSDVSRTPGHAGASPSSTSHSFLQQSPTQARSSPKMPKRDGYPSSMQSILNDDPPPPPSSMPVRTSGQSYDPIRGISGPARDAPTHTPYSPASGSPRAPAQANKSPSIASLLEPAAPAMSPSTSHSGYQVSRLQDERSIPASPSNQPPRPFAARPAPEKSEALDVPRPVVNPSNFTTIANGPVRKVSPKHTGVSTPRTDMEDLGTEGDGRSILDFGKAKPGEEADVPTIILSIPISTGETNKYVNFLRLAEDRYGWDALHPRLAANRDRKARIAAAAATLEKIESGRESDDEMSVDLSDAEGSNPEVAGASGTDNQPKPKKKRNFKEDQYDVDDDFVDDSEMLWEAQAAASRDGFFVYSGPLVPEVEKPAADTEGPVRRGRGGRGSRGGGRGATRATGTGRGGGPGSRGGIVRKPRITKAERLLREKEKADRESMALVPKTPTSGYVLPHSTPIQLGV